MVQIHNGKITNLNINLKTTTKVVGAVCEPNKNLIVLRFTVPNPDYESKFGSWSTYGPTMCEYVYLEPHDIIIIGGNRFECTEISDYEATRLAKNISTLIDLEKLV